MRWGFNSKVMNRQFNGGNYWKGICMQRCLELFLVSMLLLCLAFLNVPYSQLLGGKCQRLLFSILIQACRALLYGTGDKVGSDAMQQRLLGKFHWWHPVTLNQTLLNKMSFVWIVMHQSNYLCVWPPLRTPLHPSDNVRLPSSPSLLSSQSRASAGSQTCVTIATADV